MKDLESEELLSLNAGYTLAMRGQHEHLQILLGALKGNNHQVLFILIIICLCFFFFCLCKIYLFIYLL